ncbi:MAG: DUF4249 domain-containing protein [Bacteroidia bacterium]|jgi:hypothetical protein|nr:DUF4249 domain-containing protein [Bacteroidota bacterium]MCF8201066.1 DUF4249 domain-containing protein [Bacteroidia bacterium]
MKFNISLIVNSLIAIGIGLLSTGCEDVIQVDVIQKSPKIVVDAFVNNQLDTQTIKLTRSIGYFDSTGSEPAINNAQVAIVDQSAALPKLFVFAPAGQGKYQFLPNPITGDTFSIGHDYALLVVIGNDTLVSFSTLNPTTTIDSLSLVDVEGNGPPINTTGKYVELMAKDRKGPGDFYWIKTFRNDSFLNNISQLNISADMGNTSRGQDGELFIYPVRYNGVNDFSRSFKTGETVRIEIHSINAVAFAWFNLVVSENQNGGLFATPPANIFTNIVSFNPNKKTGVGGFFCVSAVTSASVTIP